MTAKLSSLRTLPAGFVAPCLLTSASQPPSGDLWLHEIKHDGSVIEALDTFVSSERVSPDAIREAR